MRGKRLCLTGPRNLRPGGTITPGRRPSSRRRRRESSTEHNRQEGPQKQKQPKTLEGSRKRWFRPRHLRRLVISASLLFRFCVYSSRLSTGRRWPLRPLVPTAKQEHQNNALMRLLQGTRRSRQPVSSDLNTTDQAKLCMGAWPLEGEASLSTGDERPRTRHHGVRKAFPAMRPQSHVNGKQDFAVGPGNAG